MTEKQIQAIEHNHKLYYDCKRKDLDILLTSTIPTQKNLMKTLLWLNATILGLCLATLKEADNISIAISILIPFLLSFVAIFIVLLSLKSGRSKTFGAPSVEQIEKIEDNIWTKTQALVDINNSIIQAFDENSKIVQNRAKKISCATNLTILSMCTVFIAIVLYANTSYERRQQMSEKKKTQAPKPMVAVSTSQPSHKLYTNETNKNIVIAGRKEIPIKDSNKSKD